MRLVVLFCLAACMLSFNRKTDDPSLKGAWEGEFDGKKIAIIFSDQYFSAAVYDLAGKNFLGTYGGRWEKSGEELHQVQEYNTLSKHQIGRKTPAYFTMKEGKLMLQMQNASVNLRKVDHAENALAGAWLITGREVEGQEEKITPGARRTMKILSGTRFQWIAYNVDTGEFFGTGGGTYKTDDGDYTEKIEFFSRDNSRVGMKLEFDYDIKEGNWHHKGFSSKGDKINEVWSRRETLGI